MSRGAERIKVQIASMLVIATIIVFRTSVYSVNTLDQL